MRCWLSISVAVLSRWLFAISWFRSFFHLVSPHPSPLSLDTEIERSSRWLLYWHHAALTVVILTAVNDWCRKQAVTCGPIYGITYLRIVIPELLSVSIAVADVMITSSNGNIFRITGHLCGKFTGHQWIPCTKASDAELWCFLWSAPDWTVE